MADDAAGESDEPVTFGQELLQAAREALAVARGEAEPARVYIPSRRAKGMERDPEEVKRSPARR